MTQIVWAPQARQDLKRIYVGIARFNVVAAVATTRTIKDKINLLSRHPHIGVARPDIWPGARMTVVPPYLIFHEIVFGISQQPRKVQILRILDGRRDLADLL